MKFKEGDKARVISRADGLDGHEFRIGEVVTITKCFPKTNKDHYCVHGFNDFWYMEDEELEPITKS